MRILYIDCGMGAAGDMLTAALLELIPNPNGFIEELNSLGIPKVKYIKERSVKCGICGTHIKVLVEGIEEGEHQHDHDHSHNHSQEHSHNGLHEIEHIVCDLLHLPQKVKDDVMQVYGLIAEAESKAHGVPVSDIHFHEVGTMDAIADVVAVCLLINRLNVDNIIASPVHVGSGKVKCAHGILPVPAPATAYILQNVPVYSGAVKGELCTPTGAALLKYFVNKFGTMPIMRTQSIGYGMGTKDFETANCLRVMLGDTDDVLEEICELSCNVDDMTGEAVGYAMERLFESGALDVYTAAIGMKKSRPGILIHIMCHEKDKEELIKTLFKHTTTIGIRESKLQRYILEREITSIETAYGNVRCKVSKGYGVERKKYEFDDVTRIAKETGKSIDELIREIQFKDVLKEYKV